MFYFPSYSLELSPAEKVIKQLNKFLALNFAEIIASKTLCKEVEFINEKTSFEFGKSL
jgi:hypothetical protein